MQLPVSLVAREGILWEVVTDFSCSGKAVKRNGTFGPGTGLNTCLLLLGLCHHVQAFSHSDLWLLVHTSTPIEVFSLH